MGAKVSAAGASGGGQLPVPADAFVREDGVITAPPEAGGGITPPAGDIGGTTDTPTVVSTHLTDPLPTAQGGTGMDAAWQFLPETYGAAGDGKVITDATIASEALSTLTSASADFTSADTGKDILVSQAGGSATEPFAATITYVNATTVTLGSAASNAVSGVGAIYGTDDTTAVQDAINDAVTYAQDNNGYAEIALQPGYYCIAGEFIKGGPTLGNSQLTLPVIDPASGVKVTLKLAGAGGVSAPPQHWLSTNISPPGSVLVGMRTDGTYDGTYGPAALLSGPVDGYGGGGGTFSNMLLVVDGITTLLPYNASYGGLMLFGLAGASVPAYTCQVMAVTPSGAPWPQLSTTGPGSDQYTIGLCMPAVGNNDVVEIGRYTAYGVYAALAASDHLSCKTLCTLYCGVGLLPIGVPTDNVTAHGLSILSWSCEATAYPVETIQNVSTTWPEFELQGYVPIKVAALDLEVYQAIIHGDSNNYLLGEVWFEDLSEASGLPTYFDSTTLTDSAYLKLIAIAQVLGPVPSPEAAPSSTDAWANLYYRDAAMTLSVSGGTLSALSLQMPNGTSVDQAVPDSAAFYQFVLPPGCSYTPTYTGTASHTVTLL